MVDITGPDDDHPHINNNAFTLAASSLALHYARYFSCLCQRNERDEVPEEYIQKAMFLNMPYDNVKRLHYQFEGFDPGKEYLYCSYCEKTC
jgi:protein-glucosylgalactosylhydroxylysine glucosidase